MRELFKVIQIVSVLSAAAAFQSCGYFSKEDPPVDNRPEEIKQAMEQVPPEFLEMLKNMSPEDRESLKKLKKEDFALLREMDVLLKKLSGLTEQQKETLKNLTEEDWAMFDKFGSLTANQKEAIKKMLGDEALMKKLMELGPDELAMLEKWDSLPEAQKQALKKLLGDEALLKRISELSQDDLALLTKLGQMPEQQKQALKKLLANDALMKKISSLTEQEIALLEKMKDLPFTPAQIEKLSRLNAEQREYLARFLNDFDPADYDPIPESNIALREQIIKETAECMENKYNFHQLLDPAQASSPSAVIDRLKNLGLYWHNGNTSTRWFRQPMGLHVIAPRIVVGLMFQSSVWKYDVNKTADWVKFRLMHIDPKSDCSIGRVVEEQVTHPEHHHYIFEWVAVPAKLCPPPKDGMNVTDSSGTPLNPFTRFVVGIFDQRAAQTRSTCPIKEEAARITLDLNTVK